MVIYRLCIIIYNVNVYISDFLNTQHNQWRRLKRQSEENIRYVEVNIFYNQTLEYKKNTLIVNDSSGEVSRYG